MRHGRTQTAGTRKRRRLALERNCNAVRSRQCTPRPPRRSQPPRLAVFVPDGKRAGRAKKTVIPLPFGMKLKV